MFPLFGISNAFNRHSASITGDAWTKFPASGNSRAGIEIRNPDSSLKLWIRRQERSTAAPSAPTGPQDADFSIAPDETRTLAYSEAIDLYFCNSSASSTTSNYVATEVAF